MVSPRKRVRNAMGFRILVVLFSMAWRWKVYVQGMFCTYVLCTSYNGNARWRWICWVQFISENPMSQTWFEDVSERQLRCQTPWKRERRNHGQITVGFSRTGQAKAINKTYKKKTKQRLVTNEVRTRSERGTKRGQKLPGTDPYPNPGAGRFSASANSCSGIRSSKNEKNKYRSNPNGDKMIPWNIYQFT